MLPVDYQSFSPLTDGLGTADARNENSNRVAIEAPPSASSTKQSGQESAPNNDKNKQDKSKSTRDTVSISAQGKQAVEEESSQDLSEDEQDQVQTLKDRDREVRVHEQAHAAVGGQYAGAPSYDYETGPDGKRYAVGGEVSIDVSREQDPQDTIDKMQIVRAAALAPAEPSTQDLKVAAQATQQEGQARAQLSQQVLETDPAKSNTNSKTLAYQQVSEYQAKSQFIARA
jgi:hypothetical protein